MNTENPIDFRCEREMMVEYLGRQLIGPLNGREESFVGDPLDRYLLGILYPRSAPAIEMIQEEDSVDTTASDEEIELDNPISMAFERLPASLGLSFYVQGTDHLTCRVQGSCYRLVKKEKANETWARVSIAEPEDPETYTIICPLPGSATERRPVLQNRASLHSLWRPLGNGFLVTVTLLNQYTAGEGRPSTDKCLFQIGLSCTGDGGSISDYPILSATRYDPEEEELALLYRGRRVFAVGHGCAAMWHGEGQGLTVSTAVMPVHETFPVTRDLAEMTQERDEEFSMELLSLQYLADHRVPHARLCAELRAFVRRYQRWIQGIAAEAKAVPSLHKQAAERIVERINCAVDRMERSIRCLESDDLVLRAFRLATRAMLMQMVHSGSEYGGTMRKCNEKVFAEPAYQGESVRQYRWYPFQLAFMLLTMESVVDPSVKEREIVDLIWFPTGGGKTEAYLWVAALELFLRRLRHGDMGAGTAVIKRYTLRLLTSQQFQRAASLICACERIRQSENNLGSINFSLGLWIGGQSTANSHQEATRQYENLLDQIEPENPFQLQRCPWCGTRIIPELQEADRAFYGVRASNTRFDFFCPTVSCPFNERLPIAVVDDELYLRPPSMLIGTIDKFARMAWDERSKAFFGGRFLPPGLVIQDELHLISGPLGTIAGIYEAAIDGLLTANGHRPKIIAATATIRRAQDQAQRLYARDVAIFPPSGLNAEDSYFARIDDSKPGRLYVGIMGQGHTSVTSLVRSVAAVSQAPMELPALSEETKDGYWTVLVYHNSKRELGKTMALARDDIPARIHVIAADESNLRVIENVEELSANISGRRIPEVLAQLGRSLGDDAIDILPCTNMVSVGVDVKRLGLMVVVGQPKTTAEYIQATSRVGRDVVPGLVITMFSPTKPRDRSHYESFNSYHDALYRWVEPTSVTPFALPSRERALHAALVILARHLAGLSENAAAERFDPEVDPMKSLIEWLIARTSRAEPAEAFATERHIRRLVDQWAKRALDARDRRTSPLRYNGAVGNQFEALLCTYENQSPPAWPTLNSMRHVDLETPIWVKGETI
ncbi:MAG: helicase-related protein [Bacteroidia bacterium]|nr:helicase-related protein [Bacteroidia bacterium]